MIDIDFSGDYAKSFVSEFEVGSLQEKVNRLHTELENGATNESDYLGWLHLPSKTPTSVLSSIASTKHEIVDQCNVLVCIGIGGSYLGARAAISFLSSAFGNQTGPEIYFAGQNACSDYHADLLELLADKNVYINFISKSGTTMESSIAFRLLRS